MAKGNKRTGKIKSPANNKGNILKSYINIKLTSPNKVTAMLTKTYTNNTISFSQGLTIQ